MLLRANTIVNVQSHIFILPCNTGAVDVVDSFASGVHTVI